MILKNICASAILICIFASNSFACTLLGLDHSVTFLPEKSKIESTEIRSLVNWYIGKNRGGIAALGIFATAKKGTQSTLLANQRIENLIQFFQIRSVNDEPIISKDISLVNDDSISDISEFNIVHLIAQPACTRTNTCCLSPSDQ